MPSIPGKYRPVSIAAALLGIGLVVHGFVKIHSIQSAATAAMYNLEISSGALLMIVSAMYLARRDRGPEAPKLSTRFKVSLFICLGAVVLVSGFVLVHNLCTACS